jgi:putative cell wall-binding protein
MNTKGTMTKQINNKTETSRAKNDWKLGKQNYERKEYNKEIEEIIENLTFVNKKKQCKYNNRKI